MLCVLKMPFFIYIFSLHLSLTHSHNCCLVYLFCLFLFFVVFTKKYVGVLKRFFFFFNFVSRRHLRSEKVELENPGYCVVKWTHIKKQINNKIPLIIVENKQQILYAQVFSWFCTNDYWLECVRELVAIPFYCFLPTKFHHHSCKFVIVLFEL